MKIIKKALLIAVLLLISAHANAGVDATGYVSKMWIHSDGKIWFRLDNTSADTYCVPGWNGFNMYIPSDDPNATFYYGVIATSLLKAKLVTLGNISMFDGTTPCNITQTGYGIAIYQ